MDLNPIKYRDEVNNALKAAGILKPMVATVGISQSKQNIVITTTQDCTADQLLAKKPIWEGLFQLKEARKDDKWHKVVVHELPTEVFNNENGMEMLKQEVETFN